MTSSDAIFDKFVKRWEEVTELPPQTLGPLTPLYKTIVKRLKVMPWAALLLFSLVIVIGIYLLLGSAVTLVVSLLQRGF